MWGFLYEDERLNRFYTHRIKKAVLEIDDEIKEDRIDEYRNQRRFVLCYQSEIDRSEEAKEQESKSGNRKEIKPETEVFILKGSKKGTDGFHYRIVVYSFSSFLPLFTFQLPIYRLQFHSSMV